MVLPLHIALSLLTLGLGVRMLVKGEGRQFPLLLAYLLTFPLDALLRVALPGEVFWYRVWPVWTWLLFGLRVMVVGEWFLWMALGLEEGRRKWLVRMAWAMALWMVMILWAATGMGMGMGTGDWFESLGGVRQYAYLGLTVWVWAVLGERWVEPWPALGCVERRGHLLGIYMGLVWLGSVSASGSWIWGGLKRDLDHWRPFELAPLIGLGIVTVALAMDMEMGYGKRKRQREEQEQKDAASEAANEAVGRSSSPAPSSAAAWSGGTLRTLNCSREP